MRGGAAVLLFGVARVAAASDLVIEVRSAGGSPPDAVVYAIPETSKVPRSTRRAVLDQKNRMFVPHILPVQTGTAVSFPNSDNVRHQVYSFSPAKRFQLPLYAGTPAEPVVFDKPGVVTVGCNIHDQMNAYIVVVDTPYFARTEEGRAEFTGLPEGRYDVHVWSPGQRREVPSQGVALGPGEKKSIAFQTGKD